MFKFTNFVRRGALTTLFATTMLISGQAQSADTIMLKLGHFLPTANGMHRDFLEPWARDLEKCSNGAVKIEIYPAGTQLGHIARLYDGVQAGALDIAHGLMGVPSGRFGKTMLIELPFMAKKSSAATRALWNVFEQELADEFPGVKILALHTTNSGQIHTSKKQVAEMKDLKGLRLRFPSSAIKNMLEHLGATPVGLPPTGVYENLERNVIDGTVFTWDSMASFKLAEVTKYHYDAQIYVASFWFGMNQNRYDTLPENVRQCVDNLSGETLINKFGNWWDGWDKTGHDLVQGDGHTVINATAEEREAWRSALGPVSDVYIAGLEKKGVGNARAIYDKMKAEIAKLEKE